MIIIVLLFQLVYSSAMFSQLNQNSFYFDFSNFYDNVTFINENSELDDNNAILQKISIGYVFDGKYDFCFKLINNQSINNEYNFPSIKNNYSFNFNYYIKDFEKIPLNFNLGYKHVWSNSSLFKYNALNFGSYINFIMSEYPSVAYVNFSFIDGLDSSLYSDNSNITSGINIKLLVDEKDNNLYKDIIFLGINLNTDDFSKYYFGVNFGLYHPFK
jgi:hypothetical protein